jgi:thioredoxin 1
MTTRDVNRDWNRDVNYEEFEREVLQVSQQHPVLVDFRAEWCSPCLVIAPLLKQLVEEYAGAVWLAKVEVDVGENMKLAGRYRVRGFPTLMLFNMGTEQGHFSGARPARYIRDFLEQHDIRPAIA